MTLRIGIDATSVLDEHSGVEVHVRTAVDALADLGTGDQLVAFVRRQAPPEWVDRPNLDVRVLEADNQAWATQVSLARAASSARLDVLYCPAKPPPALCRVPVLDALHDTVPWTRPETMGRGAARWYRTFDGLAVRRGAHVATVSHASADDIVRTLRIDRARVHVVGNALSPSLRSLSPAMDDLPVADGRYVLSLCRMEPRKDLPTLLDAWPAVHEQLPDLRLVLAGKAGWGVDGIMGRAQRMPGVDLLGWVDDAELVRLYRHATVFVTPSLQEGFGLPVLEAMAFGAPVVASDIAAHREVGGGAVRTFAPGSAAQLASAVLDVATDSSLVARMRADGLRRAAAFSPKAVAERLHAALVTTAERSPVPA